VPRDAALFSFPSVRATPGGARLNEPLERKFSESNLSRLSASVTHGRGRGAAEPRIDPSTEGLVEALRPHGVDDELLAALLDGARRARIDDDYYKLETAFSEVFDFAPLKAAAGAPVMLVGPTGAGKTSCSAKLSAAAMTRGGGAFMLTAAVGRDGAVEQVRTYGESLGADYYIVETPLDVAQALRSKRPRGFVLLDTPGISPFDAGDLAALKSFQEASSAEPVLVLPASGDTNEWRDWAQAFAEFGVRRMIITKFDATKRVGAGLSAAHAGRMALANFSESPFISEGLLPASAEFLAKRLLAARPGRIGG